MSITCMDTDFSRKHLELDYLNTELRCLSNEEKKGCWGEERKRYYQFKVY